MPQALANNFDVPDPLTKVRAEVKNLFLIETVQGSSYDSCLAVTGKELVQASLVNMQSELWRQDYVDAITQAYEGLAEGKPFQIEVDRVDYCASHLQVVPCDDVDMEDADDGEATEQYLNLFCLVKARRQQTSSYETEHETLIAHFQTQVCGEPSQVAGQNNA